MLHIPVFLLLPLSFLFDFKLSNETCMLIVLVLVHICTNLLVQVISDVQSMCPDST